MSGASASRQPIRVGVIGSGFAASSHLDALRRVAGLEIAGLVGSTPERGIAAAERLGVGRAYPDVDAMLGDPEVDAVHVCTPNDLHGPQTLAALEAGKHVLTEKPLGLDAGEAVRLAAAAAGADAVTGVCFNYRHFPLVQQARAMVAGGGTGPVHFASGAYLQDWLLRADDWNWRLEVERAGTARAMGDIGSHWIDTVEHVTGDRVAEVCADLGRLHTERLRPAGEVETFARSEAGRVPVAVETDDFGSVVLRFESGARGTFAVSQVSAGRKNHLWFQVDTAEAALAWDQEEPNRLWIGRRDQPNEDLVRDPGLLDDGPGRLVHFPGGHQEGWPDALRNLFEDFYGAVDAHRRGEERTRTFASFEEAAHVARVVEAIAASDETRAWQRVRPAAQDQTTAMTEEGVR